MIVVALLVVAIILCGIWWSGALWFRLPVGVYGRYAAMAAWGLLSLLTIVMLVRGDWRSLLLYAVVLIGLGLWWSSIKPSNNRQWADDVAEMLSAEINGNSVTLHNVRNFAWRTETDYTPRWETRRYDLDTLTSVDMILSYWGRPGIAHTLVSFGFADGQFVVFSVEIRKEKNESFSEIGGFFKEFETSIVAADERDIIRLRPNVRGEDTYIYRIRMPKEAARSLFIAYVEAANALIERPRFYNTITANCTTIVYEMVKRIVPGLPMDYRLVLSGYLPEYIYDVGGLDTHTSVEALRARGRITERAIAADGSSDFSQAIRAGVPGIPALTRAPTEGLR
ncbi:Lnb N-terminal periplasmic domain-containing protein [Chelatococcus asaccharovorans]|uniref:Uncharacterized protein DUF4105 n=1 Tax=Chelatococcus asaccharovorans TaxID=28210 RepID=A0A2V3U0X2_9HYPH|nr:DUF4105 domain-containing protein [Chelatococcus asaccharovorans]PXW55853.1 uncharacterized protein DUF4105 [Chelatococcus asaccharovorans]CAH1665008.1 conserved membrane hypothetical protein [Chelatococcus asaccharovorans]CAH1682162.1 conserved membrane hypothetical protein [Chelatococcus asaccharovorans]